MKTHTSQYKDNIKLFGRELDSRIIYTLGNEEIELGPENLNSITPHYEGGILKSVMKQLDIDSNIEIPLNTEINYKFGLKINNTYEYIDFGNYIVYNVEKQEDTSSYKIICYDKILYSMKDYEDMNLTYPITMRNYINAVCNKLGLIFKNANDTFANYDKVIQNELYLNSDGESIGYTFRDVLDEIAQATGSTICLDNNDQLEIRYINDTNDTINEEYLKNINVKFGEKYGPINSIVLSRAGDSDNVYLQDEESIEENGLCEIKISENQFMNFNDRSDYLEDLLDVLGGLEYYINDFSSTGVCYYDLCDRYNVSIDNNIYSCVMFNDEVNITQGLEENIHTDIPEETQTDYKKADKTDRKINQTYIMVDKQNQTITSLAENVSTYDNRISVVEQSVDGITSTVSDIVDAVRNETGYSVTLENCAEGSLQSLILWGNVLPLYPNTNLYPSENLFPKPTKYYLSHSYTESNETITELIELPFKYLGYINESTCDKFIINNEGNAKVIRNVGINNDGTLYALSSPTEEDYGSLFINNKEGTNTYFFTPYYNVKLDIDYVIKNALTDVYSTKVEVNSKISQTRNEIELSVDQKTDTDELISKINLKPGHILLEGTVTANENFKILTDGSIEAVNGNFSGNIYLSDGNKVIGGDGLFSNLTFVSTGERGGWTKLGFCTASQGDTQYGQVFYADAFVDYFIPENFVVENAYAVLDVSASDAYYENASGVQQTIGRVNSIKLFEGSGTSVNPMSVYEGGSSVYETIYERYGTEIANAWKDGQASITDTSSSPGQVLTFYTDDISSYLRVGEKTTLFARSTITKPSPSTYVIGGQTFYNFKNIVEKTGVGRIYLYVYGYMSIPNEEG